MRSIRQKVWFVALLLVATLAWGHESPPHDLYQLKLLSIDELSSAEQSVSSKIPTESVHTPAAVYILTAEDIRRSGARNLPETLRQVPGLNVAAVTSSAFAVSARGFNETFANKFLVLLDGRRLFNNTYGGIYWDMANVRLGDIERIEVVRGPGSAVWGANAMNGVINIITRSAYTTSGGEAQLALGDAHKALDGRYGWEINEDTSARFSTNAQWTRSDRAVDESGLGAFASKSLDDADNTRLAFRLDHEPGDGDTWMLDAAYFQGRSQQRLFVTEENPNAPDFNTVVQPAINNWQLANIPNQQIYSMLILPQFGMCHYCLMDINDQQTFSGGHLLGRWQHQDEARWDALQVYLDYTERADYQLAQEAFVGDISWETGEVTRLGKYVWGLGWRGQYGYIRPNLSTTPVLDFSPRTLYESQLSGFAQYEWALSQDWSLTTGLRYEYSNQFGSSWQPTLRLSGALTDQLHWWSALSYSSRLPSRIESSGRSNAPYQAVGDPQHSAERLLATEAGIRWQPTPVLAIDVAGFRYRYRDLSSVQITQLFNPILNQTGTIVFGSEAEATAHGLELAAIWDVTPRWRLRGAYSWLEQTVHALPYGTEALVSDAKSPSHQLALMSHWDLHADLELDLAMYYVDSLGSTGSQLLSADPAISSYTRLDARLNWFLSPTLELSLIGQNLLDRAHPEFVSSPLNVGGVVESTQKERTLTLQMKVRF